MTVPHHRHPVLIVEFARRVAGEEPAGGGGVQREGGRVELTQRAKWADTENVGALSVLDAHANGSGARGAVIHSRRTPSAG